MILFSFKNTIHKVFHYLNADNTKAEIQKDGRQIYGNYVTFV